MSLLERTPRPHGPRALPGLGISLAYGRDAFATLERMVLDYGPVSYGRLTGLPMLFLAEPADMEHVLVRNHANYIKDKYLQVSKRFLGEGLLTSEGDLWKRQRRLIQPAFHPHRVAEYGPAMVEATERRVRDWRPGEVRAIDEEMRLLTLDIAVRTLFGSGLDAARSTSAGRAVADLSEFAEWTSSSLWGAANFVLPWLPSEANRRSKRALRDLDAIVYDLVAERRRAGGGGNDVLSRLLKAQDEGGGMSDRQLRDEVLTLFLAGHETTALALTYTWRLLADHHDVQSRAAEQAVDVLGGRAPTVADLERLPFIEDVVKESMRLYPPAYVIGREALDEDEVGGWPVRPGDNVAMSAWATHRDPRFYDDPRAFRPERWTPAFEAALPRMAYFPFGGGPRVCIGAGFAMLEARLVVADLVQRFRFERADSAPLRLQAAVTARPKDPVRLRIAKR